MRLNVIFLWPFFGGRDGQFISAYYKSFGRSKIFAKTALQRALRMWIILAVALGEVGLALVLILRYKRNGEGLVEFEPGQAAVEAAIF
jgi:hypothetical protein